MGCTTSKCRCTSTVSVAKGREPQTGGSATTSTSEVANFALMQERRRQLRRMMIGDGGAGIYLRRATAARAQQQHQRSVASFASSSSLPPPAEGAECAVCSASLSESTTTVITTTTAAPAPVVVVRLPCGHDFHLVCLDRWLQASPTCPLCRQTPWLRSVAVPKPDEHLGGAVATPGGLHAPSEIRLALATPASMACTPSDGGASPSSGGAGSRLAQPPGRPPHHRLVMPACLG